MTAVARKSKSEAAKEWRERMERERPEYMALQRAKARERARARHEANKDNPEYIQAERERKRAHAQKCRQDPEYLAALNERRRADAAKPDAKAKQAQRMKEWKAKNAEQVSEYQKAWRERNAEAVKAYSAEYSKSYRAIPEIQQKVWERNLRKNYDLTPAEFNKLWVDQDGECAICFVEMEPRGRSKTAVAIDHNHATGEVRGLLCRACNHGIGHLKDNPEVLESAAQYLRAKGFYGNHSFKEV